MLCNVFAFWLRLSVNLRKWLSKKCRLCLPLKSFSNYKKLSYQSEWFFNDPFYESISSESLSLKSALVRLLFSPKKLRIIACLETKSFFFIFSHSKLKGHRIEMGRNRSITTSMTWRVVCRRSLLLRTSPLSRCMLVDFLCSVPATGIRRLPFAPTIIIRSSLIMNLRVHDSENPITLE